MTRSRVAADLCRASASAEEHGQPQPASSSRDALLRGFCLGLIVVQNSSLIVVTSYSRTLVPAYLPSVAVTLSEFAKLGAAVLLLAYEQRSFKVAARQIRGLLYEHSRETLLFAVPALCYTLQNNLWYYALSHLDSITAAVTSQMKVITTAVASVFMLGRRLSSLQWIALCLLMLGMIVMQIRSTRRILAAPGRVVPHNSASGACAMLLSTALSAYAGVFLEKLFKTVKLTLWLQSIQLSLFALPVSCLCMLMYDAPHVLDGSLLVGFNQWAWLTVCLSAVGGIAVSMALKYADNILKTFAVGCSIVLNCAVSTAFLGVPLTWQVICGVVLVVSSTCLFNASALVGGAFGGTLGGAGAPKTDPSEEEMEPLREQSDGELSESGSLRDASVHGTKPSGLTIELARVNSSDKFLNERRSPGSSTGSTPGLNSSVSPRLPPTSPHGTRSGDARDVGADGLSAQQQHAAGQHVGPENT